MSKKKEKTMMFPESSDATHYGLCRFALSIQDLQEKSQTDAALGALLKMGFDPQARQFNSKLLGYGDLNYMQALSAFSNTAQRGVELQSGAVFESLKEAGISLKGLESYPDGITPFVCALLARNVRLAREILSVEPDVSTPIQQNHYLIARSIGSGLQDGSASGVFLRQLAQMRELRSEDDAYKILEHLVDHFESNPKSRATHFVHDFVIAMLEQDESPALAKKWIEKAQQWVKDDSTLGSAPMVNYATTQNALYRNDSYAVCFSDVNEEVLLADYGSMGGGKRAPISDQSFVQEQIKVGLGVYVLRRINTLEPLAIGGVGKFLKALPECAFESCYKEFCHPDKMKIYKTIVSKKMQEPGVLMTNGLCQMILGTVSRWERTSQSQEDSVKQRAIMRPRVKELGPVISKYMPLWLQDPLENLIPYEVINEEYYSKIQSIFLQRSIFEVCGALQVCASDDALGTMLYQEIIEALPTLDEKRKAIICEQLLEGARWCVFQMASPIDNDPACLGEKKLEPEWFGENTKDLLSKYEKMATSLGTPAWEEGLLKSLLARLQEKSPELLVEGALIETLKTMGVMRAAVALLPHVSEESAKRAGALIAKEASDVNLGDMVKELQSLIGSSGRDAKEILLKKKVLQDHLPETFAPLGHYLDPKQRESLLKHLKAWEEGSGVGFAEQCELQWITPSAKRKGTTVRL